MKTISFSAERVATDVETFTETCRVYSVAFQAGDLDADGEGWTFSRSFEDDDGVCTVREIQRATLYDGIRELRLSRARLTCVFEAAAAAEAGCERLEIDLQLEERTWDIIARMLDIVCSGKSFYHRD